MKKLPFSQSTHSRRRVALHNETATPRPTRPSRPSNREDERAGFLLVDVRKPRARLRRVSTPNRNVPVRRLDTCGENCGEIRRGTPRSDRRLRRAQGPTRARALLTQSGVLNRARVYHSGACIARIRLEQLLGDGSREIGPHERQKRDDIVELLQY